MIIFLWSWLILDYRYLIYLIHIRNRLTRNFCSFLLFRGLNGLLVWYPSWDMSCLQHYFSVCWDISFTISTSKDSSFLKHRIELRHWLGKAMLKTCVMCACEKLCEVEISICIEFSKTHKVIENLWHLRIFFISTIVCLKHFVWVEIIEL